MKYIDFTTFAKLYSEAVESSDVDIFISERGWQEEWMGCFGVTKIVQILQEIYFLAHHNFSEVRKKYGANRTAFSRKYYIPSRSLQEWETGNRTAPVYVTLLLYYTLFLDAVFGEAGEQ